MRVTVRAIKPIVAFKTGVSLAEMDEQCRRAPNAGARQVVFWLARQTAKPPTLPMIAAATAVDNHTTVLFGVRRCDERRAALPEWANLTDDCLDIVRSLERDEPWALALWRLINEPSALVAERKHHRLAFERMLYVLNARTRANPQGDTQAWRRLFGPTSRERFSGNHFSDIECEPSLSA
jgi:hypothetical protein